jgi:hypothetical protein
MSISMKLSHMQRHWMIYPFACALVVIGAKCWMISRYGSPTPFWDQWDAEGALLYPKYLSSTLHISDLIEPANQHRILVTRLWSLLLLELEGYWDPVLQMIANTLVLGAAVALLIVAFRPMLDHRLWLVFALFSTVFFIPFGWDSTLGGYLSQWYFLLLFSISGLTVIIGSAAFSPRWCLSLFLLILSFFSMAGGALTMAAAFAVTLVQLVIGRRSGPRELLALATLAGMTVGMVLYTPGLANDAPEKAHSAAQFLQALVTILSWPAATGTQSMIKATVLAILTYAPGCLMALDLIRHRLPITDRRWLPVTLIGWTSLQAVALAYGRTDVTTSRYLDVLAVGLLANAACVLYFLSAHAEFRLQRRLAIAAVAVWVVPVLLGARLAVKNSIRDMEDRGAQFRAQTENLRAYLVTGDIRALENKARLDIPYPDPQRLAQIASMPVIRGLLPPALVGQATAARAQERGLARFTGRTVEAVKQFALRWGALLMLAGVILFVLGLATPRLKTVLKPAPSET